EMKGVSSNGSLAHRVSSSLRLKLFVPAAYGGCFRSACGGDPDHPAVDAASAPRPWPTSRSEISQMHILACDLCCDPSVLCSGSINSYDRCGQCIFRN